MGKNGVFEPLSKDAARAVCAVFMGVLFASRAVKNGWAGAVEEQQKRKAITAAGTPLTNGGVKVSSLSGVSTGKFVQHSPKRRGMLLSLSLVVRRLTDCL